MKKIRLLFINGVALSFTALITGLLGVWLNMIITNRAGAAVMGKYQLITSVCTFAVTYAVSGINFAAMRLCAEGGISEGGNVGKIMKKCFAYALVFGISGCAALFFGAKFLADKFIKYSGGAYCLRMFAITLPMTACLSAISGYLTAARRAYKESFVKISVQILKLLLTAVFLIKLTENPCVSVMSAAVISEAAGALTSLAVYIIDRRKTEKAKIAQCGKLLPLALPMAFSSYLRCGIMTLKNLLVPIGLVRFGLDEASSAAAFGIVHGIALPAALFPSTLLFSFSSLTVPELAGARTLCSSIKSSKKICYIIDRSMQLTMLYAAFFSGFMFFFADELAAVLSSDPGTVLCLRTFALIIPIMYLDNTTDNMLKGLNEQVTSMEINIIDSVFCLAMVIFLLPKFGIRGYLFTICAGEILNFSLSIMRLIKISAITIKPYRHIFLPFLSVTACCVTAVMFAKNLHVFAKLGICLPAYALLVSALGAFTKDDRMWLKGIFSVANKTNGTGQNKYGDKNEYKIKKEEAAPFGFGKSRKGIHRIRKKIGL